MSYERGENATYGFEFVDLPPLTSGRVMAKAIDIFDNSVETVYMTYNCTNDDEMTNKPSTSAYASPMPSVYSRFMLVMFSALSLIILSS